MQQRTKKGLPFGKPFLGEFRSVFSGCSGS